MGQVVGRYLHRQRIFALQRRMIRAVEQPVALGIVFAPSEFFADADRTIFDANGLHSPAAQVCREFREMAPAVGFEPTTNRLTADRSTTELRWNFCGSVASAYMLLTHPRAASPFSHGRNSDLQSVRIRNTHFPRRGVEQPGSSSGS
jgi:hypothetical protein